MKAVILSGGKQYVVAEKEQILVDLIDKKVGEKLEFSPLMLIDGKNSKIGAPEISGAKVSAKVVEPLVKGEKVRAIRFEAKKRVNKITGFRKQMTRIEIVKIA